MAAANCWSSVRSANIPHRNVDQQAADDGVRGRRVGGAGRRRHRARRGRLSIVGSFFGGVGAVPGAFIGGIIGGAAFGYWGGSKAGENYYDSVANQ